MAQRPSRIFPEIYVASKASDYGNDELCVSVKCKTSSSGGFYGKSGRKYMLSSQAQKVLSTVLEDMIEDTLEDARKLAQGMGKDKVAIEDVEMAMVNLCQRLHPHSTTRLDVTSAEYDVSPRKPRSKYRRHLHQDNHDQHFERVSNPGNP